MGASGPGSSSSASGQKVELGAETKKSPRLGGQRSISTGISIDGAALCQKGSSRARKNDPRWLMRGPVASGGDGGAGFDFRVRAPSTFFEFGGGRVSTPYPNGRERSADFEVFAWAEVTWPRDAVSFVGKSKRRLGKPAVPERHGQRNQYSFNLPITKPCRCGARSVGDVSEVVGVGLLACEPGQGLRIFGPPASWRPMRRRREARGRMGL